MSNSRKEMDNVSVEDRALNRESKYHKALGITWDLKEDSLHFPLNFKHANSTRRGLLSKVCSLKVYDPLGIIAPSVHQAKLLLHQMLYKGNDWDQPFPKEGKKAYNKWCANLNRVKQDTVARCDSSGETMFNVELHTLLYRICSVLAS